MNVSSMVKLLLNVCLFLLCDVCNCINLHRLTVLCDVLSNFDPKE